MDSTVERHGTYKNYDYLVINVHGTHFCAYVRIPKEHPFYKVPYGCIPIDCHGGLTFSDFTDFSLIFTKLDETGYYGNIYNIRKYADAPLSYITNGQDAARDISVLDPQKLVTRLMGGS